MTKEEILKRAIFKAVENGWKDLLSANVFKDINWKYAIKQKYHYSIIFSHNFARAFWKNDKTEPRFVDLRNWMLYDEECPTYCGDIWEYHLQNMVISKDPIKYLEQFVK